MSFNKVLIIIFLSLFISIIKAQRDTVTFNSLKEEYEIKYWAKIADKDSFMTVIFIPSNKVIPIIHSRVIKDNNFYNYSYTIKNSTESKMPLEQFILEIDTTLNFVNQNWNDWEFGREYRVSGYMWFGDKDLLIGETKDKFCIQSNNLPGIGNSFFLGRTPFYSMSEEETSIFLENSLRELMQFSRNSVNKKTIIPVYLSPDISNLILTDSLLSYNSRSRILSWITTQQTADKYNKFLKNTKAALQQNKNVLARCCLQDVLKNVDIDSSSTITSEAYALLRYNTEYLLSKLPAQTGLIVRLVNSNNDILTGGTLQYYDNSWKNAVDNQDGTFIVNTTFKTISLRMTYATGQQTISNVTVGNDIVTFKTTNVSVQLKDSQGNPLDVGTVQYYFNSWQTFGSTTNGIATKELLQNNYTFRITYAAATKDKAQDVGVNPTVVFQTVPATVQLKNSTGNFIDQGAVQYYFNSWQNFGSTTNGVVVKELLPNNYTFRMTYATATKDKAQDIGTNPTVIFQIVPATVQLKNSSGNFIDAGTVQYYFNSWQNFGSTTNGVVTKELLPNNYTFRMTYATATKDKVQDVGTNPTVIFQTVPATVQLKNSSGNFIDQGTVQYYFNSWQTFGATTSGIVTKELLPNNYTFRMTYATATKDKAQDVSTNSTVVFQTVPTTVQLKNSSGNFIDQGTVQYYYNSWQTFGSTTNGVVVKELLQNNYTFRMSYETVTNDKVQDISSNNSVLFSTVLCRVRVKDAQSQPVNNAMASYYFNSWKQIGNTINGEVTKELLPANLTFRVVSGSTQRDKTQNISTNSIVEFGL